MVMNTRRLALMSLAAVLLVIAVCLTVPAKSPPLDDGWRRTAQGWEQLAESPAIARVQSDLRSSPTNGRTSPFHPLLLVALQVSLIAAAYWRLPVKGVGRPFRTDMTA
jgi:hypothetical protein